MAASDTQVGGSHYKNQKIQPHVYSHQNNLSWHQGEVVKYVTRFRDKGGKQDLEKAIHVLQLLIEVEYPEEVNQQTNRLTRGVCGTASHSHSDTHERLVDCLSWRPVSQERIIA